MLLNILYYEFFKNKQFNKNYTKMSLTVNFHDVSDKFSYITEHQIQLIIGNYEMLFGFDVFDFSCKLDVAEFKDMLKAFNTNKKCTAYLSRNTNKGIIYFRYEDGKFSIVNTTGSSKSGGCKSTVTIDYKENKGKIKELIKRICYYVCEEIEMF